jgi:hypothetical protein
MTDFFDDDDTDALDHCDLSERDTLRYKDLLQEEESLWEEDYPESSPEAYLEEPTWAYLVSRAIRRVRYHYAENTLEVEFNSGQMYSYSDVPESVYTGLINSSSPGRYYHANIRGQY